MELPKITRRSWTLGCALLALSGIYRRVIMGPTFAFKDGVKEREVCKIYMHCSDTVRGSAKGIDVTHKELGWSEIGYHYVVTQEGEIEKGRPEWKEGAHVKGFNKDSLGVCLIGKDGLFKVEQIQAAARLVRELCQKYLLSYNDIHGHYEANSGKTCPGFKIEAFRGLVRRD